MEGIYGSEEIGVAERAAKFRNIHNVRLRLPHQLQSMYRAWQKNGSQVARIFQARPGRAVKQEQEQTSRNHVQAF